MIRSLEATETLLRGCIEIPEIDEMFLQIDKTLSEQGKCLPQTERREKTGKRFPRVRSSSHDARTQIGTRGRPGRRVHLSCFEPGITSALVPKSIIRITL